MTDSLHLQDTPDGVVVPVRAQAGARQNSIRGVRNGHLVIAVTAIAEKGKANEALIRFLANRLDIAPSAIELLSGQTSPRKTLRIANLTAADIRSRI